jgi:hypothetical protein
MFATVIRGLMILLDLVVFIIPVALLVTELTVNKMLRARMLFAPVMQR